MKVDILTLFPEFFNNLKDWSIVGRAIDSEVLKLDTIDIRKFSTNKHKKVDDYPYGGGPGMIMMPDVVGKSISSVRQKNSLVVYMSPQGQRLDQKLVNKLSKESHLILLCGHYEGIDNRVIENEVDLEISIGDYVLTGGEIPSMVLIDSLVRLLPGVLSNKESYKEDSHYNGWLEYPQYTRPREYKGIKVPDILLSGNHQKIEEWRTYKSIENTYLKRPDMIHGKKLTKYEKKILEDIKDKNSKKI